MEGCEVVVGTGGTGSEVGGVGEAVEERARQTALYAS